LLRNVSVFSANVATGNVEGVATGVAEAAGGARRDGDGLTDPSGAGEAELAAGVGRGGACFATHHSHATRPMTQSMTTIHAVRSIKFGAPAIHARESSRWL
jgi:hypothetical protein